MPSMMCADFSSLKQEVERLEKSNVDGYHIDIMDGEFVPNFGMGLQDLEYIRKSTNKKVDVHLMIENPANSIDIFADIGVDIIYIHPEADKHPARTLERINGMHIKSGIAINPGTSIETIKPLLSLIDYIMIMTVNPGFSGQQYLSYVNDKLNKIIDLKKRLEYNFYIMVDGAISPQKVQSLSKMGVEGFILGTSSLFGKNETYTNIIKSLRADK